MRNSYIASAIAEIKVALEEANYDDATEHFEQLTNDLQTDPDLVEDEDELPEA